MDFGDAIRALKEGKRVARDGWNGKGMWLQICPEGTRTGFHPGAMRAYIEMKDATDQFVPWLASQTDMLAEDWQVVS